MIRSILGPKLFRQSLARYVETYKFQNALLTEALDVFNKIAKENGMSDSIPFKMQTIMMSWMNQKGIHPLIIVKRNNQTMEVTVSRVSMYLIYFTPITPKSDKEKRGITFG